MEQALGIEIITDQDNPAGYGRVVGWLAPPGAVADVAYYRHPDMLDRPTEACCQVEVAHLELGLDKAPCLTVESLQDLFRQKGWSFNGEMHSTRLSFLIAGDFIAEQVPFFEGIAKLKGAGSLTFEFQHAGKNCASSVSASQFR